MLTRGERGKARVEWLSKQPLLINSARIAYTFHLDPVQVLDDADSFHGQVRAAALEVFQRDEETRAREQRKK